MTVAQEYIGVDVSKTWLDIHFLSTGVHRRLPNEAAALTELAAEVRSANALTVFEASGGYERPLMAALDRANAPRARVNAKRARDFARASGQLAKTDKVDARVLAEMGAALRLGANTPRTSAQDRLTGLARRLEALKRMEKSERQRRQCEADPFIRRDIDAMRRSLRRRIAAMEAEVARLIAETPDLAKAERLMRTIPGIGPALAPRILGYLPELGDMNRRGAAALAGLAPYACDSGLMKGRRMIWGGRPEAARALFLAAFIATRHDPTFRAFRERLQAKGKKPKVAIIAAARKLVTLINAMLKTGETYKPNATA